jgi:hypothetical protein
MSRKTLWFHAAVASLVASACSDRPVVLAPDASMTAAPIAGMPDDPREALTRTLALALRSPIMRAYLRAKLQTSPFREQKVQFQRFLEADGRHALLRIAAETRTPAGTVARTADATMPLEVYLPVAAHRRAWLGDGNILVATELRDGDTPVAYDTAGTRFLLNPDTPPAIPVLALVPVETDFATPPSAMMCLSECGGGGDGPNQPPPLPSGLYLAQAHFTQAFESWLKGSPEFEVHVLGQKEQADSLTDYQCVGEHQGAPYYYDQNGLDWSGSVLVFSQSQLNDYHATHPGQNVRVYVVEDDDTACQIKTDGVRFSDGLAVLDSILSGFAGGKDTVAGGSNRFRAAKVAVKLFSTVASLINTNDELVGNAVADSVAGEFHPNANWVVRGANNVTNGWINLEMR